MDLSNMLGGLGGNEGAVDPNQLITGVQDVFASKGGVEGLVSSLRAGGLSGAVDSAKWRRVASTASVNRPSAVRSTSSRRSQAAW